MNAVYWLLALGFIVTTSPTAWTIARTPRDGKPKPKPKRMYEAPFRQPGKPLDKRPEGNAALKAEIAKMPAGLPRFEDLVPTPPANLHTRKEHDDWRFSTLEWEIARESFFADQPDDQAVQRVWVGAGR